MSGEAINITVPNSVFSASAVMAPAATFHLSIVVDKCMDCGRRLGGTFHIVERAAICDACYAGKVQQFHQIDTDSYAELPPE